jgi:sigma-B regulation protein RsbU (phosphoserine phosphatase)
MALSRTLLRTYAGEYPDHADEVLAAVNQRILSEARAGLFVTMFYAILDPESGTLTYVNAGHHPAYLFSPGAGTVPQPLRRTGMALGLLETARWEQETVATGSGDRLLLYTDGVTDATSPQETMFGDDRLLEVTQEHAARPVDQIQAAILGALDRFTADAPQLDDITLVVLARDA